MLLEAGELRWKGQKASEGPVNLLARGARCQAQRYGRVGSLKGSVRKSTPTKEIYLCVGGWGGKGGDN